jgi:hypothetical protein
VPFEVLVAELRRSVGLALDVISGADGTGEREAQMQEIAVLRGIQARLQALDVESSDT